MDASDGKRREAFSFGAKIKRGGSMAKRGHKGLVIKGSAHMGKKGHKKGHKKGGRRKRSRK